MLLALLVDLLCCDVKCVIWCICSHQKMYSSGYPGYPSMPYPHYYSHGYGYPAGPPMSHQQQYSYTIGTYIPHVFSLHAMLSDSVVQYLSTALWVELISG